ncbi:MAG: ribosome-associated translation inhibitor RaiA [Bacteroidales bacterium]|nr:ribosome-associated translation inhibitor RaiA [Bacteroidales bacterium]MCF8404986.1 ribosome-associated translation inhibitor RaiA [Bacteroidales bacterium]
MQVNINSVRFKADKRLTAFINEKVEKLSSYYEGVIGSEITLKVENTEEPENKVAEIRLIIPGNDLYAKKQCKTFEEATDSAVDALRRQITKHKSKLRTR